MENADTKTILGFKLAIFGYNLRIFIIRIENPSQFSMHLLVTKSSPNFDSKFRIYVSLNPDLVFSDDLD